MALLTRRRVKRFLLFVLGTILALIIIRLIFFEGPYREPQELPDAPIIDLHCHIAGLGIGSECFVSDELLESYKADFYFSAMGVSLEELQAEGDALVGRRISERLARSEHVSHAVILAMDGIIVDGELDRDRTQVYVPNEFVAAQARAHENLLFGASVNPYRKDALARLEKVASEGAHLIKWIPSIMAIDPADETLRPFYEKLVELDLPLLSHTGQERSFSHAQDELCDPLRLRLPLSLGVTVIAAHVSTTGENEGQDNFERILPMFGEYERLYADISSLTQVNKLGFLGRALARPELEGRLLYGSDYPLPFFPLVSPMWFPLNLDVSTIRKIEDLDNPWDRDVGLKQALGVPADIFNSSRKLLGIGR